MCSPTHSTCRFRHAPATLMVILLLAGCSSSTPSAPVTDGRYASQTLADLEEAEIQVEAGEIEQASVKGALESYKQAVQLFSDPEKRVESLRRMADLAMAASTSQEGEEIPDEPVVPGRLSSEAEVRLDREIDAMLFQSFMQGAKDAKTQEEMYQMLDLAGGILPELEDTELAANYETAIQLYQTVIARSQNPTEKAEAYYLLAKAYDIAGRTEESQETLKELGRLYPGSQFYLEAQFRMAESYFSEGEFDLAVMAYSEVVHAGDKTPFLEQAHYKRGWSHYKLSDYDKALVDFFTLIEKFETLAQQDAGKSLEEGIGSKILEDTYRVASLSFNNLDGAKSVTEWFRTHGARPYEHKLYRTLGDIYVRQDRYVDAAETYETFVSLYPDSDLAPAFSSMAIKSLQDGGFPSQVLPAKERFVTAYGVESPYWKRHEAQRAEYLPLLKSHLLDLSKHYHAQAQRTPDESSGFLIAAGWYKKLIELDPQDPQAASLNQLYAEALFSGRDFAGAVREFERTAYDFPDYENASDAGYFGLVAWQALGDESRAGGGAEADYQAILDQKIKAGLRFAQAFPDHEKSPNVLQSIVEDQLEKKDIAGAVGTAGLLVSLNPQPPTELLKYGWQTIANGEFDIGRYKVAEFGYGKVLAFELKADERKAYSERLAASIYKQGEQLVSEGKQLEAAAEFLRVSTAVPGSTVRATAEFDAATIYLKSEQWALAIPVLEQFRQTYPEHELSETVPDKLALAYEKTGNWIAAARELESIHDKNLTSEPELARAALWQAAELTAKASDESGVVRLYSRYVSLHPSPLEPRMEAQFRLLTIYEQRGELKNRDAMLASLANDARNAGTEASARTNYLGAYASFTLAEPVFQRFSDYKLKQPLRASLGDKRRLMQAAIDSYSAIARLGVAEYVSAAQYRTAEIYRILAADLMASERPRGLGELELEQYDLLLEEQALPLEDQAIDLYIQNANLVTKDVYDDWVKKSLSALAVLQPGRYGKKEQIENYVDIIY